MTAELAREAFAAKNYDLSVDIYERLIKENGPSANLYLGLGDALSRGGQTRKAFESYSNACRLGSVRPSQLNNLVSVLVDATIEIDMIEGKTKEAYDMFTCDICKGLWTEPRTLHCGHTFCKRCLEKQPRKCYKCDEKHIGRFQNIRTNVLLSSTVNKWFSKDLQAMKLKSEGNGHFSRQNYSKALGLYTRALELVPEDHLVLSNRSHTFASLEQHHEALMDAELVVELKPDWPKGYFRKGAALEALGHNELAAHSYLQCLALDPSISSARTGLTKMLHGLLSPVAPGPLKASERTSMLAGASMMDSYGAAAGRPVLRLLTSDTLQQLKSSLYETIRSAKNHKESLKCHFTTVDALANSDAEDTRDKLCSSAPSSHSSSPNLHRHLPKAQSMECMDTWENTSSRKRGCRDSFSEGGCPIGQRKCARVTNGLLVRDVPAHLLNKEDFECSLCYRLLFNPVTTPCGHTFCRDCLNRCMDHSSQCPLCKSCLAEYLAERSHATTEAVEMIVSSYFPSEFRERKINHEEEMAELARMGSDKQHDIPIFVCTLGFPGIPCPLHIFEPRYRLMVRQCMESGTRQFGMCVALSSDDNGFSDYGTMLEIRDVQYFPDGRSLVDTVGGRRFRVIERSHRDGYDTAKVEYLEDAAIPAADRPAVETLHNKVYAEAQTWFASLNQQQQARIRQHLGNFPVIDPSQMGRGSGPGWMWWLLAALPLDPRAQLTLLTMTSVKERLAMLAKVLNYARQRASPQ